MAANADPSEQGDTSPCIDRQSAGESSGRSMTDTGPTGFDALRSDHRPETFYLTKIALLEARVATLEAELESCDADLRHVVDRYERVLQGRDACRDEPLVADEFDIEPSDPADADRTAGDGPSAGRDGERSPGPLDRLRGLLD